jgi:hypothetical protein
MYQIFGRSSSLHDKEKTLHPEFPEGIGMQGFSTFSEMCGEPL